MADSFFCELPQRTVISTNSPGQCFNLGGRIIGRTSVEAAAPNEISPEDSLIPPQIIKRESWGAMPPRSGVEFVVYGDNLDETLSSIVVHHTAFPANATPIQIQNHEMSKGYDDVAYHYIIGEDGTIYEGRPINVMGAHAGQTREANAAANQARATQTAVDSASRLDPDYGAIGIALQGDFTYKEPTPEQLTALKRLIGYLQVKYHIPKQHIIGHRQVKAEIVERAGLHFEGNETICPGANIYNPLAQMVADLPEDSLQARDKLYPATAVDKKVMVEMFSHPASRNNLHERLSWLAAAYKKAKAAGDELFARQCQIQAARDVQFAMREKVERELFEEIVRPLGIYLPSTKRGKGGGLRSYISSKAYDFGHVTQMLWEDPGGTTDKIVANLGGGNDELKSQPIDSRASDPGLLGLERRKLIALVREGDKITRTSVGEMILASPNLQLSVGYRVITDKSQEIDAQQAYQAGYALFATANYFDGYTQDHFYPATLSIVNGQPHNLFISQMDGLVIIKEGRVRVVSAREVDPAVLAAYALDNHYSVFQTNLIVHKGKNVVPEGGSYTRDVRCLLVTFNDGRSGLIRLNEYLTLYDVGQVVSKIPGVVEAVNLDTGQANMGGVVTENGLVELGPYKAMTVIYYQFTPYYQHTCMRGKCGAL